MTKITHGKGEQDAAVKSDQDEEKVAELSMSLFHYEKGRGENRRRFMAVVYNAGRSYAVAGCLVKLTTDQRIKTDSQPCGCYAFLKCLP